MGGASLYLAGAFFLGLGIAVSPWFLACLLIMSFAAFLLEVVCGG